MASVNIQRAISTNSLLTQINRRLRSVAGSAVLWRVQGKTVKVHRGSCFINGVKFFVNQDKNPVVKDIYCLGFKGLSLG